MGKRLKSFEMVAFLNPRGVVDHFCRRLALRFDHFGRHGTWKWARPRLGRKKLIVLTLRPYTAPLGNLDRGEQICMHMNVHKFQDIVCGERCCITLTYSA